MGFLISANAIKIGTLASSTGVEMTELLTRNSTNRAASSTMVDDGRVTFNGPICCQVAAVSGIRNFTVFHQLDSNFDCIYRGTAIPQHCHGDIRSAIPVRS